MPGLRSQITKILLTVIVLNWVPCWGDKLPTCQPKDFHYEFTDCDADGGRWRVSVPTPESCVGGAPNPPLRVNCTISCPAGTFFDSDSLGCLNCTKGTFSLGGGVRFDSWDKIPPEFTVSVESSKSSFQRNKSRIDKENNTVCGWQPKSSYIESSGPCSSFLYYSTKLIKEGTLTYTYQHTDGDVLFQFQALNDQCDFFTENKFLSLTEEGEWKTVTVPLYKGLYVLRWEILGSDLEGRKSNKPVKIKSIEITGVAHTANCTSCPPGSFSDTDGASDCKLCPPNTASGRKATNCEPCSNDKYAPTGSAECIPRPKCTKNDMYEIRTPCRRNETIIKTEYVQPSICDKDHEESISLPHSSVPASCPRCNAGMQHSDNKLCNYCPAGSFSDGFKGCKKCPPSTIPDYGYFLTQWYELSAGVDSRCVSLNDFSCPNNMAWIASGDHVRTRTSYGDDEYLILSVDVEGFRHALPSSVYEAAVYGTVKFSFSLECEGPCEFIFMSNTTKHKFSKIQSWTGATHGKLNYTHFVNRNETITFSWAFHRSSEDPTAPTKQGFGIRDVAKMFHINVTNTVKGGAETCIHCPAGEDNGCVPCVASHDNQEKDSYTKYCKQCGPGLHIVNKQTCYSDCLVNLPGSEHFDFQSLPKYFEIKGRDLFATSGTRYFHTFNISLCGASSLATCVNNVTFSSPNFAPFDVLTSHICRSTIVPPQNGKIPVSLQLLSLGDELIGITTKPTYKNISVVEEFRKDDEKRSSIHFYYTSSIPTSACPLGHATTISLACDQTQNPSGVVQLPKKCPDGTCNGCTFHFLWKTPLACRVCIPEDYQVVVGECISGKQILHYVSPKGCNPSSRIAKTFVREKACSVIPRQLQIIICVGVGLGILLLGMLLYFYKKNRRLEYKYMKLIQSSSCKDGELPAAESCGIDEDDEEHYGNVAFEK